MKMIVEIMTEELGKSAKINKFIKDEKIKDIEREKKALDMSQHFKTSRELLASVGISYD